MGINRMETNLIPNFQPQVLFDILNDYRVKSGLNRVKYEDIEDLDGNIGVSIRSVFCNFAFGNIRRNINVINVDPLHFFYFFVGEEGKDVDILFTIIHELLHIFSMNLSGFITYKSLNEAITQHLTFEILKEYKKRVGEKYEFGAFSHFSYFIEVFFFRKICSLLSKEAMVDVSLIYKGFFRSYFSGITINYANDITSNLKIIELLNLFFQNYCKINLNLIK